MVESASICTSIPLHGLGLWHHIAIQIIIHLKQPTHHLNRIIWWSEIHPLLAFHLLARPNLTIPACYIFLLNWQVCIFSKIPRFLLKTVSKVVPLINIFWHKIILKLCLVVRYQVLTVLILDVRFRWLWLLYPVADCCSIFILTMCWIWVLSTSANNSRNWIFYSASAATCLEAF